MLTTKEAAKIADVNDSRIRQLILDGTLRAERFGWAWGVDEKSLRKYISERKLTGKTRETVGIPVSDSKYRG